MRADKCAIRNTFGSSYDQYEKNIIAEGTSHYLGRGPSCNLSQDAKDLSKLKK